MPAGHTPVRDVVGGVSTMVHVQGVGVLRVDEKTDPLPALRSRYYRVIDDVTHTACAWYGAIHLLKPVACQSDGTQYLGI